MATTVTHVVDPDSGAGYTYDSLYDWEAGEQGDLTGVRDEISVAKCRCTGGTADTTAVEINGWETSATQYIKIWTDPAESYRSPGNWTTGNKYRLEVGGAATAIALVEDFVHIYGLQISGTGGADVVIAPNGRAYIYIAYNIIKGANGGSEAIYVAANYSADQFYIWNNVFYDHGNTGVWFRGASSGLFFFNNTFQNCLSGIAVLNAGSTVCKNNLFSGCTNAFGGVQACGDLAAGTDYNVTNNPDFGDYTVTGGAGGHDHVSHTITFVGAADFHLASNDAGAIGFGVADPGSGLFSDDIDGVARGATWDVGADEYVEAVSAINISVADSFGIAESLD